MLLPRILLLALSCLVAGCQAQRYEPARATRAYPYDLHGDESVDIQVFREDTKLVIVNSTARSYYDFDIWVNQRYVLHVDSCAAGETLTLSLWDFYDLRGDSFNAGGFFRTIQATPVRLVEAQPANGDPLIGLTTIRASDDAPL